MVTELALAAVEGFEMSSLDVVAKLTDHQQNLTPKPRQPYAVLLALPPPLLCTLIATDLFRQRRQYALSLWAMRLGGGDGPMAIIDLAVHHQSLAEIMADLVTQNIEIIYLYGAEDQPGFTRTLQFRWPFEYRYLPKETELQRNDLDPLQPTRSINSDYALDSIELCSPCPATSSLRLLPLTASSNPIEVTASQQTPCYAYDPQRRLGSSNGIAPPEALTGNAFSNALIQQWKTYWCQQGYSSALTSALLGLDTLLEQRLQQPTTRQRQSPSPKASIFVITGIDGTGKSTHAELLKQRLRKLGITTKTLKIYRQGAFLELANELSGRTQLGAPLAAFRVSRIVKLIDSLKVLRDDILPLQTACDVLIMDRYLETHIAAARSQLTWDIKNHPIIQAFPPALRSFWLQLEPDIALQRILERGDTPSADEHSVGLQGYAQEFAELATTDQDIVLNSRDSLQDNASKIASNVLSVLNHNVPPIETARPFKASLPQQAKRRERCQIILGYPVDNDLLNNEIFSLREFLKQQIGLTQAAIPEAFWLEAYAAQLLLDVRCSHSQQVSVSLWPAVLAEMPIFKDISMLLEFDRLLHPLCYIIGYTNKLAPIVQSFCGLGAELDCAERLALDYLDQLEKLGKERNWQKLGDC